MNNSQNFGFYLPEDSDPIHVTDLNANFLIIDSVLTEIQPISDSEISEMWSDNSTKNS